MPEVKSKSAAASARGKKQKHSRHLPPLQSFQLSNRPTMHIRLLTTGQIVRLLHQYDYYYNVGHAQVVPRHAQCARALACLGVLACFLVVPHRLHVQLSWVSGGSSGGDQTDDRSHRAQSCGLLTPCVGVSKSPVNPPGDPVLLRGICTRRYRSGRSIDLSSKSCPKLCQCHADMSGTESDPANRPTAAARVARLAMACCLTLVSEYYFPRKRERSDAPAFS